MKDQHVIAVRTYRHAADVAPAVIEGVRLSIDEYLGADYASQPVMTPRSGVWLAAAGAAALHEVRRRWLPTFTSAKGAIGVVGDRSTADWLDRKRSKPCTRLTIAEPLAPDASFGVILANYAGLRPHLLPAYLMGLDRARRPGATCLAALADDRAVSMFRGRLGGGWIAAAAGPVRVIAHGLH